MPIHKEKYKYAIDFPGKQKYIEEGILLPDTDMGILGEPLSTLETQAFLAIHSSGVSPITTEEIHRQVYGYEMDKKMGDDNKMWAVIFKIRQKLGEWSILTICDLGYVSTRAMIENKFRNSD